MRPESSAVQKCTGCAVPINGSHTAMFGDQVWHCTCLVRYLIGENKVLRDKILPIGDPSDRYLTVIDHVFTFSPTDDERRLAMELLNLKHRGSAVAPLDVACEPDHVSAHRQCVTSRSVTIAMGLLPDGSWEIATPVAVVARERYRAEAMARTGRPLTRGPIALSTDPQEVRDRADMVFERAEFGRWVLIKDLSGKAAEDAELSGPTDDQHRKVGDDHVADEALKRTVTGERVYHHRKVGDRVTLRNGRLDEWGVIRRFAVDGPKPIVVQFPDGSVVGYEDGELDPPLKVERTRALSLLDLCNLLESVALAASGGVWRGTRDQVLTDGHDRDVTSGYDGGLVCESICVADAAHVVSTQPKVMLALVAKIRGLVNLVNMWLELASIHNPEPIAKEVTDALREILTIEVP